VKAAKPRIDGHLKHEKAEFTCTSCGATFMRKWSAMENSRKTHGTILCPSCAMSHSGTNEYRGGTFKARMGNRYDTWHANSSAASYFHTLNRELKGISYEERYGAEKAADIRARISKTGRLKSKHAPAPQGSGNGWSGHYHGTYFRSLKELSFIINVIEAEHHTFENAEKACFGIPYADEKGDMHIHYADFVLDGSTIVEVKPARLAQSPKVKAKQAAGEKWAAERGMQYVLRLDNSFPLLTDEQMTTLHDSGDVVFISRYEAKYQQRICSAKISQDTYTGL
jgi:predicted RNA-binding Zn-ribbon protein involved in translation (DUF1610 family)